MVRRKNKNINKGATLFLLVFVSFFCILFVRFAYIGITKQVEGHDLIQMANDRWIEHDRLKAKRGSIYDVNGYALAENIIAYTVTAVLSKKAPHHDYVKDPEKTAEKLGPILGMDQKRLLELLTKKDVYQVELGPGGRRISGDKKNKIEKLHLPGIGFIDETKRYYPNQMFASYVLGFTQRDEPTGKLRGIMGIEKSMNQKLTGENGSTSFFADRNGVELSGSNKEKTPSTDGDHVYLTIDSHIQTFLDHAMTQTFKKYKPKKMMAIVMNPKTGAILAMSNRPGFNPNLRDIKNYHNNVISTPFEPGSTMKIFTLAAAVDLGVYKGNDKYQSGALHIPGGTVHDWKSGGWGKITFDEAIERSSNVGFAILAKKYIGFDRLHDYLLKFDFDKKTGIALPNEANSTINFDYAYGKIATSFGQATAITMIQEMRAATAVANNGQMMEPYIIDRVVNPNTGETVMKNKPKVAGHPISAETAKKVRHLLRSVVAGKYGTGTEFNIKGYKIVGKTGTAQIPKKDGSGYMDGEYIHSFLGMAPEDDPKLMVYVVVDRPDVKTSFDGSKPVADVFNFVLKHSLEYLNIDPVQNVRTKQPVIIDDYQGKSASKISDSLEDKGFHVITLGSGKTILSGQPLPGTKQLPGIRMMLLTGGEIKMPDMTGWPLADVTKLASLIHLQLETSGSGYVTKQGISPGETVKEGEKLKVTLSPPK